MGRGRAFDRWFPWRRRAGTVEPVEATPTGREPNTVFVLSGGSVRGAAQAGMLRVLLEAGVHPDALVAVSAGALNATFLAADPTVEQARRLEDVWRDVAERKPIRGSVVRNVAAIVRGKPSFDTGDRLRSVIADHAPIDDL